jgi:hypothetical protein
MASYLPRCSGGSKPKKEPGAKAKGGRAGEGCRDATSCLAMCEAGTALGCLTLASMYENGIGIDADADRALEFYRRACRAGAERGCEAVKAAEAARAQAEQQQQQRQQQRQTEEQQQQQERQRQQEAQQRQQEEQQHHHEERAHVEASAGHASPPPGGIAAFKSYLGIQCGGTEPQLLSLFGQPSVRSTGSPRSQLMWNDIGVNVQLVAATGRIAFIQQMLSTRKRPPPGDDAKARYLGAAAGDVVRDFGAPMAPGDSVMYQDQKNKVMVSFYCPKQRCEAIMVYCLAE